MHSTSRNISQKGNENDKVIVLWDSQICTDRQIPCNKPDIVIREKESDRCLLIDIAIPSDNTRKKTTEKMNNYVDLQIECQRMWNKNVGVVPIVTGATGLVDKNIKRHLTQVSITSITCRSQPYLEQHRY